MRTDHRGTLIGTGISLIIMWLAFWFYETHPHVPSANDTAYVRCFSGVGGRAPALPDAVLDWYCDEHTTTQDRNRLETGFNFKTWEFTPGPLEPGKAQPMERDRPQ